MAETEAAANAAPYSVSELAAALKRTVESAYGYVRVRGELSRVTRPASGHVYFDLKDETASIGCVVWKGAARALAVRPEQGLEVIVTGRMTTYPARSTYQIVVETMEPAGVGALLAQLERLKAKLKAEGLFDAARKRPIPAFPSVVGVVTSPTGSVIQDILHRLSERWPCRVILWPVLVQGEQAAAQVTAAIRGFGALPAGVPRPDVLIVARGGGSVEDLWPFNDEALARAAAASLIPLISAVGHETDTTLIDYVSDRRAPTPSAAAEMATPVRAELVAALNDFERRMVVAGERSLEVRRARLAAAGRGLPRPADLIGMAGQRLDNAGQRLGAGLGANLAVHARAFAAAGATLRPRLLTGLVDQQAKALERAGARLAPAARRRLSALVDRLTALGALLASLEPRAPLRRGFALVRHADGGLATLAAQLAAGEAVGLEFADGALGAHIDGEAPFALTPGS